MNGRLEWPEKFEILKGNIDKNLDNEWWISRYDLENKNKITKKWDCNIIFQRKGKHKYNE